MDGTIMIEIGEMDQIELLKMNAANLISLPIKRKTNQSYYFIKLTANIHSIQSDTSTKSSYN